MKIYDTLETLESKIEQLINTMSQDIIKSITGDECYHKPSYNAFNV